MKKLDSLIKLISASDKEIYPFARRMFRDWQFKQGKLYLYGKPKCKKANAILVAHIDTHRFSKPSIFRKGDLIYAYKDALGADGRAGLYMTLVLAKRFKIPFLLTDMALSNDIGAIEFALENKSRLKGIDLAIGFDLQGFQKFSFCKKGNKTAKKRLKKVLKRLNFTNSNEKTNIIKELTKLLNLTGINLSNGFYITRAGIEVLNVKHFIDQLNMYKRIIPEIVKYKPEVNFENSISEIYERKEVIA